MKIINANTNFAKEDVLGLLETMPNKMVDFDRLRQWLDTSIGTEVFNVWMSVQDDKPVGLITAEIVDEIEPTVFIGFCVAHNGETKDLLNHAEAWAKDNDIHKLLFHTHRNPMPFVKKFGFNIRKVEMTKEI